MKVSFWAMGCVSVFLSVGPQSARAEEKTPGQKMSRPLDETTHLLDPISVTTKDHLTKAKKHAVNVGDKVLIQIRYDPKKVNVEKVDVRFSGRWMAACEIVKVPQKPAKKGEDPVAVVGVVVRATIGGKPCSVAVSLNGKGGSELCLYFPFDIKPKP